MSINSQTRSKWILDIFKKSREKETVSDCDDQYKLMGKDRKLIPESVPRSSIPEDDHKYTEITNCQCCGLILTYPVASDRFKCSACDTINVTGRNTDKRDPVPLPLSYKSICEDVDRVMLKAETLISQGKKDHSLREVFEPLSINMYKSFKSKECLNNSFKLKWKSKSLHYTTSNIDRSAIRSTFILLSRLPTKKPLFNALSAAVELLKRSTVLTDDDPRCLVFLLIFLEIPFIRQAILPMTSKSENKMVDVLEIRLLLIEVFSRTLGKLAHATTPNSNNYICSWFAMLPKEDFMEKVDLLNLYITIQLKEYYTLAQKYQLNRKRPLSISSNRRNYTTTSTTEIEKNDGTSSDSSRISSSQGANSNHITNVLGSGPSKKEQVVKIKLIQYGNDWHLKCSSLVLNMFVKANFVREHRFPCNVFYNSLVDYVNLKIDFDSWQVNRKLQIMKPNECTSPDIQTVLSYINDTSGQYMSAPDFFFCQYPFLISLGAKITILEFEARIKMERKAEEAFINALDKKSVVDVYFRVVVRRENIVQDSLRCIKLNLANLQKSLRVQFVNEPGIDAGGLKKEWFSLLTKSLFTPSAGMFTEVESNYLWFHVIALNGLEMYYLFGVIMGLAIYNSTILDLNFPPAVYKILLGKPLSFADYRMIFPEVADNLMKLKGYNEDELTSLALTFEVLFYDTIGMHHTHELIPNGNRIEVDKTNVDKYIEKYYMFFLSEGISKQLGQLTRGFSDVIGGNAQSLFLPEEIELLLCGSDEKQLDINVLKSITNYTGWKDSIEAENSEVVIWFWEYMNSISFKEHQKILRFVTGSDRVPATGLQNLNFKISLVGHTDSDRLPVAHTCFNELAIYQYNSKKKFIYKLQQAISESSGFGLK